MTGFWIILGIAFVGSLFACRDWRNRIFFTIGMPVIYCLMFMLCFFSFGALASGFAPGMESETLQIAASTFSWFGCAIIFCIQVWSMSRDPRDKRVTSRGFSIRRPRNYSKSAHSSGLQRLPTRKRMGG